MTNQDVVRHPLVQQIVKAYDDYDKRMEKQRKEISSKKTGVLNIEKPDTDR